MPDQPSWIERVPEILRILDSPTAPAFLDRPAIESLFGLRRRQAIQLLSRLGGYKVGKTFLATRETLVRFLRDPARWSAASEEKGRFERVRGALGEARQELDRRRIAIPARPETFRLDFSGLPAGIHFEPGRLIVEFKHPAELLERLFALAQALGNDYGSFERSWTAAHPTAGGER
jgi:hypothetical protein